MSPDNLAQMLPVCRDHNQPSDPRALPALTRRVPLKYFSILSCQNLTSFWKSEQRWPTGCPRFQAPQLALLRPSPALALTGRRRRKRTGCLLYELSCGLGVLWLPEDLCAAPLSSSSWGQRREARGERVGERTFLFPLPSPASFSRLLRSLLHLGRQESGCKAAKCVVR